MKKTPLALTITLIVFSGIASAQEAKPYFSAKFAYAFTDTTLNVLFLEETKDFNNPGTDLAVGAKISSNIRAELAFNYRGNDSSSTYYDMSEPLYPNDYELNKYKLSSKAFMINGYYDFELLSGFKPYVGAGFGFAKVKYNISMSGISYGIPVAESMNSSKTTFAWNVFVGLGYDVNENWSLDIGYRYSDYSSFKKQWVEFETTANEITAGIRYSF